jgi:hypothetical protein
MNKKEMTKILYDHVRGDVDLVLEFLNNIYDEDDSLFVLKAMQDLKNMDKAEVIVKRYGLERNPAWVATQLKHESLTNHFGW